MLMAAEIRRMTSDPREKGAIECFVVQRSEEQQQLPVVLEHEVRFVALIVVQSFCEAHTNPVSVPFLNALRGVVKLTCCLAPSSARTSAMLIGFCNFHALLVSQLRLSLIFRISPKVHLKLNVLALSSNEMHLKSGFT
ncbi:hypothetical protein PMAYCL1PPCAC_08008 [Pristionchus mayeri]|uniref:Uncharacterized protein n=1 Tax=Pristionchus mayeri TaxID=1317129 RepID=A0AAN4ZFY4_9BILA|nr:hypothetical protein PMAYCL1PPCAC_08008 [Pristionchus mayeri]